MTTTTLTSYILTKPSDTKAVLKSLPIPSDRTPPKGRLVALFGYRDVLDALRDAYDKAERSKLSLHRVDLTIEVGKVNPPKPGLKDIPKIKFLNLARMKADLADELIRVLGRRSDAVADPVVLLGKEPELINAIWKDTRFSHLAVIVWPAPLRGGGIRQMAAIASKDVIGTIDVRGFSGELKLQMN